MCFDMVSVDIDDAGDQEIARKIKRAWWMRPGSQANYVPVFKVESAVDHAVQCHDPRTC